VEKMTDDDVVEEEEEEMVSSHPALRFASRTSPTNLGAWN
jgi:hypothetical protein